jgi:SecD/SecF fusion protein
MLYFARWKTIGIWAVVLIGMLLAAPNLFHKSFLDKLPDWLPKKQMTLGLDLQGGSHILLKVDANDLINERLQSARDEIRTALRDAKIGYTGLSGTGKYVQVRIRDASQVDAAKAALKTLTDPVAYSIIGGGSINEIEKTEPEPRILR